MNQGFKSLMRGGRPDIVQLHVIAQAIEDVLRYELGLPLEGALTDESIQIYYDALEYLKQYPAFKKRYRKLNKLNWLREVESARE